MTTSRKMTRAAFNSWEEQKQFEMNRFLQELVHCLGAMDRNFDKLNESITIQRELIRLMDKQIKKVEKDVKKGDKKDAVKSIKTLKKMDKKQDRKLDKCKMMKKKK